MSLNRDGFAKHDTEIAGCSEVSVNTTSQGSSKLVRVTNILIVSPKILTGLPCNQVESSTTDPADYSVWLLAGRVLLWSSMRVKHLSSVAAVNREMDLQTASYINGLRYARHQIDPETLEAGWPSPIA